MEVIQAPSDTDFAKMAVIIDCEANIAIHRHTNHRTYRLHLTVGSTDFRLLDWCLARFGGAIYENFYRKQNPRQAHAKRWRLEGQDVCNLLRMCLPHFIIKREQAEIAIRFQGTFGKRWERVNETDRLLREELKRNLQALTKRGPRPAVKEPAKKEIKDNLFSEEI